MQTKGFTVSGPPWRIEGWCIDLNDPSPMTVKIFVNDIFIRQIRCDVPRKDTLAAFQRDRAGFRFEFGNDVAELLPKGGMVRVETLAGEPVPAVAFIGNGKDNGDKLREKLAKGWVIDKWGLFKLPFSAAPKNRQLFLQFYKDVSDYLLDKLGFPLFISYGTLLGYARDRQPLWHDDDVDSSYVFNGTIKQAAEHFYEVVDVLAANPLFAIKIINTGHISIYKKGSGTHIDVFTSWIAEDRIFHTFFGVRGKLETTRVELEKVDMLGIEVLIPKEIEKILEFTYGESWRIPDPDFQWFGHDTQKETAMAALGKYGRTAPLFEKSIPLMFPHMYAHLKIGQQPLSETNGEQAVPAQPVADAVVAPAPVAKAVAAPPAAAAPPPAGATAVAAKPEAATAVAAKPEAAAVAAPAPAAAAPVAAKPVADAVAAAPPVTAAAVAAKPVAAAVAAPPAAAAAVAAKPEAAAVAAPAPVAAAPVAAKPDAAAVAVPPAAAAPVAAPPAAAAVVAPPSVPAADPTTSDVANACGAESVTAPLSRDPFKRAAMR